MAAGGDPQWLESGDQIASLVGATMGVLSLIVALLALRHQRREAVRAGALPRLRGLRWWLWAAFPLALPASQVPSRASPRTT